MNIVWTLHAEEQLRAIAFAIAEDRCREDAVNWVQQLREQVAPIADFPGIGHVPREPWLAAFREIDFKGHRIFYQVEGDVCYVKSVRSRRMNLTSEYSL